MKRAAITAAKNVAIQEVNGERLVKRMSDWCNRIAERAYERFIASGFTNGHDLDDWLKAEQEMLLPINLEVKDYKDELVVTAKVPGFEAKDLDIQINGSRLVIEGKHDTAQAKKGKGGKTTYTERQSRQIYKMVELPVPVQANKAHAELKNGVLELKLPKTEKPQQVKTTAA